ncbi:MULTISPECIES: asparaginase domain-containing protein [Brevibacterium]|uniref:L-asparaginase n=2 Tax=Brevibacterium antiquum TaxID=234835 RepID=A0A2H1KRN5_9MICO|nr:MULTISPECIES: asparaginase domain-containing protein [Brevibacterium]SMX88040.1 L-asparaginase [Brevibacterium antiquum]SMY02278.1 L-asparaginase [Brevibacterium antiquum CNRZ 918]HCG54760.1 asparaginase [Brevibacterium sp.]
MSANSPHLLVAALGGTIASTPNQSGGVAPALGGAEIAAAAGLDQIWPDLEADFTQVSQVSSANVTLDMIFEVRELARTSGADGIVLTQGTDTLEESAFALWLLNDSATHIAATGAMRNPTLPGADGPANVRAAALTALSPLSDGLPSSLVFNDEIHDPRFVRKSHVTSTAAFSSGPVLGAIGWLSEDTVRLPHSPSAVDVSPFAGLPRPEALAPVALVEVGMGEPEETLTQLIDSGFTGAVLAGVGGGHVPEHLVPAVARLGEAMPVILASRPGSGASLTRTYGYPGGEIGLLESGLIPAGILDSRKARIVLTLALSMGLDPAEAFAQFA